MRWRPAAVTGDVFATPAQRLSSQSFIRANVSHRQCRSPSLMPFFNIGLSAVGLCRNVAWSRLSGSWLDRDTRAAARSGTPAAAWYGPRLALYPGTF
jgi:hypothetical protein